MSAWLLALLGCTRTPDVPPAPDPTGTSDPGTTAAPVTPSPPLSPLALLVRASLDVRGVRPSPDELAAVLADPTSVDAAIEGFLTDPRFEDRLVASYQEAFLTRMESVDVNDYYALYASVDDVEAFAASAGEEPLRIMAHLALEDLPYDLAVTGDFTVVDDVLAPLWPTDRPADARGWTVAHYTDARPAAGVLATNGLWWRYPSTASNKQRKRGNTVSKLFVCRDFLKTPVVFDNDVNLLDEEALAEAIRTNPSCQTCHASLEPISSYFWGFDFGYADGFTLVDGLRYHAERERAWVTETGVAPAWNGTPGDTLKDLGQQLIRDPLFDPCAVEHVTTHLLRRPLVDTDGEAALQNALVARFRADGKTIRAIWRGLLADPRYRGVVDDATAGVPAKVMPPDLLRSVILDLTGFDWTVRGRALLDHEDGGLVTLAGGIDGRTVTTPASEPNTTSTLVLDRIASGAARFAVDTDRAAAPRDRVLFGSALTFDETPDHPADRDAMAAEMVDLYARVLSLPVAADGPEVEALLGLWSEVYAAEPDPSTAWAAVVSALLRDPSFALY